MKKILITLVVCLFVSTGFGCFIMFLTDGKNMLVANHEDWYARDAEITFIPTTGKKFGVMYFDFASEKTAQGGMNTEGLFFDGTRTPNAPYPANDSKKDCHCYIWTKILEECKTVDEAVSYVKKYKIPEMEDVHILFADRYGNSAVVGVYDEQLQIHRRNGNFQLVTNFNLSNPSFGGENKCTRYAAADSMLHIDSSATIVNAEKILSQTHQGDLTIYSYICNLTMGEVYVYSLYTRQNFTHKAKINLANELRKGKHSLRIRELVK
jgi:predicted choloylglycine hydrolase